MKPAAWICAYAMLSLPMIARAQDSPAVTAQISAARAAAGAEWAQAADFFCSTEEQVAAMKILPSATEGDVAGQRAEPMKVFDNLYFIGQKAVTTWALVTSQGIVLIDAGYGERFDDTLLPGMAKVGLDPRRIRAALIAHEHADHFGGARRLQQRFRHGYIYGANRVGRPGAEAGWAAACGTGRASRARNGHHRWSAGDLRRHHHHSGGDSRPHRRVDGIHLSRQGRVADAHGGALRWQYPQPAATFPRLAV